MSEGYLHILNIVEQEINLIEGDEYKNDVKRWWRNISSCYRRMRLSKIKLTTQIPSQGNT